MKKFLASFLIAACSYASAATLVPIQLLNPAGSTAGQMIVSQGASSTPAWSNSVQSLSANGTTTLTNTAAGGNVLKLTGNGATTPNKYLGVLNGGFTIYSSDASTQLFTLTDGGALNILSTLTPTAGIVGVATNSSAAAGIVGEYVTNTGATSGITTTTQTVTTSASLTAGDWDVQAVINYAPQTGATGTAAITGIGIGATTYAFPNSAGFSGSFGTGLGAIAVASPVVRVSIASTTTVNAIGLTIFSGGTMNATGFIRARRVR